MFKKLLSLFLLLLFQFNQLFADCTLNSNVNASSAPLAGCTGIITINSVLTMDGDYNISGQAITQVIISNTGEINWNTNCDLTLPANCQLVIQSGSAGLTSGTSGTPCNAIRRVVFGSTVVSTCNGNGSNYSFDQVNLNGGISGPLSITAGAVSTVVCNGGIISLTGSISGGVGPYTYSWTGPSGFTSSSQNPTVNPAVAGTYSVTVNDGGSNSANSSVVVTSPGTVPTAPTGTNNSRCGSGTVNLSASAPSGCTVDWYNVASGGTVLAGGSGTSSFTTPSISGTTIYYAESRNTTTGCLSTSRTAVTATVIPVVTPSITITSSTLNLCTFGVQLSSSISNGGTTPTYQWKNNGSNISGQTSSTADLTNLLNGDVITCELTSNEVCASPATVTSNSITISLAAPTTTWLGLTNDWSIGSPINWSNGYPSSNTTAIIPAGTPHDPQLNSVGECFNLVIASGASLTISGINTLSIYGSLTNDGNLVSNFGTVEFVNCVGNSALNHTISSNNSTVTNLFNMRFDDLAGMTVNSPVNITGTLTLVNGTLTNNSTLTLVSTATGTARIAPVPATANYSGNITMQRYAPGPLTGWAFLGTPVSGCTIASWQDDFATSGFTGSTGSAGSFVSIYSYNESAPGNFDDPASYVAATNITNSIPVGEGRWAYLGTGTVNTSAITIDVTGQPHIGNFNFNLSYTNNSNPSHDGFNLIANPYPSAIDWLSANWTKTNIDNAIYMWQADNSQYASFVNGIATNGGSRFIASGQGFYVHANAASPVLSITENAKSSNNPVLIRETELDNLLHLSVSGNNFKDELAVYLADGNTLAFDQDKDAIKMNSRNTDAPTFASVCGSQNLSINGLPALLNQPVQLFFKPGMNGEFTFTWNGLNNFESGTCLVINDTKTGELVSLIDSQSHIFQSDVNDSPYRFVLNISLPAAKQITQTTCSNKSDGSVIVYAETTNASEFSLENSNGESVEPSSFNSGEILFNGLSNGTYTIRHNTPFCGTHTQTVEVTSHSTGNLFLSVPALLKDNESVTLSLNGSNSSLFNWNFGDGVELISGNVVLHKFEKPGNYQVSVTEINTDCEYNAVAAINVQSSSLQNDMSINSVNNNWYADFNFNDQTKASIQVKNALGQIVNVQNFEGKSGRVKVDLENSTNGLYFIVLNNGKEIVSKKVLK